MRSDSFFNGFVWLGIIAGGLSSIRALNSFIDFGFKGIWLEVLDHYSKITQPIRELISNMLFVVEIPDWLPDVLILYSVLVMAGIRSTVMPLRFPDYCRMHNTRRTYEARYPREDMEDIAEFFARQIEFTREECVGAASHDDHFVVSMREIIPKWELVVRQSLKCMTLIPVLTLEPYRKMDISASFVRKLRKRGATSSDSMVEYETEDGANGLYARWALDVEMIRLSGVYQIISLPLLVILFLLGATYLS